MATAADLVTVQQQIRQEMADSLQRVREEMHTAITGAMQRLEQVLQKQPSRTGSAT